jgi:DNA (cytosine-5)-methyltransferase 1
LLPYRTAAECIDWSNPAPSIFERKKELVKNTKTRIAKGLQRYVIDAKEPFILRTAYKNANGFYVNSINEPFRTLTAQQDGLSVVAPHIIEHANGSNQRNMPGDEPLRTICAGVKGGHFGLTTGFIAKNYTGVIGAPLTKPLPTVTTVDHNALVSGHVLKMRNGCTGQQANEPLHTVTASGGHFGAIHGYLLKYYGTDQDPRINEPLHTLTTKERFALTTVKSIKPPYSDDVLYQAWWCARFMDDYLPQKPTKIAIPFPRKQWIDVGNNAVLYDIGMRMLQPRELFTAQGFPSDYIIDFDYKGKKVSKTSQVARCGNSVPPVFAKALLEANLPELCRDGEHYNPYQQEAA